MSLGFISRSAMVPSGHPLFNAWRKIEWGANHANELSVFISKSFHEIPIGHKFDLKTNEHVFYFNADPDVFFEDISKAGLMMGDAIHNFRSALDSAVFALAHSDSPRGVKFPHKLQFPICDNSGGWNSEMGRKRLNGVKPKHVAIIERFQPYHGKNFVNIDDTIFVNPLALLRDSSNIDKHQQITDIEFSPGEIRPHISFIQPFEAGILSGHFFHKPWDISAGNFNAEIHRLENNRKLPKTDVDMIAFVSHPVLQSRGIYIEVILYAIRIEVIRIFRELKSLF